ncbi:MULTISPECIES: DUF1289 domain-containing protein [Alteromonadaceae]|uniref:DUF1289 domain-containing protein n=1 Tax=Alteromonadaceae TaxID=72275 RepID=UPI001C080319|nr:MULTISPECIES: DUF1289 domain-containing protein [unclassified Aliiglaciecola]MBU2876914.1 DUF1289 domain-containing protein [Aliiglaciecola lipolytica]MDO6712604.1 DUF1289 domain-containing protein [Aliiglaciecola sp. 2_MG-2023]MDO6753788.1 DUF1289 domain-containing protein [Aliiglaciecola sp. 1_MG-2023]
MDQLEFFDIPSPCIGVCQSGKGGYCTGCFRSRDERLYWNQTTPYAKRVIIKACQRRKAIASRRKNGDAKTTTPQQTDMFDE